MEIHLILKLGGLVFFLAVLGFSSANVSDITCSDGGGECGSMSNSYCCVCCLICKCNAGYAENLDDESSCEPLVSSMNCTNGGGECVQDANCDTSTKLCSCKQGYIEQVNTCVSLSSTRLWTGNGILIFAVMTSLVQQVQQLNFGSFQ